MDVLKRTDWNKITEAYQMFINTGRIMPGTVRPEVELSWDRSRAVDPWTPRPEPVSRLEFNEIVQANAELLEIARPILEYMYATNNHNYDDNIIHITEKTGVVLDFFTRINSFTNPQGRRLSEANIGTSIAGTVLAMQEPLEVGGPEFYKICYQTYFGGGAPLKDKDGKLLGALVLYNNYWKIPEQPLEFVETAARLIEDLLMHPSAARKEPVETQPLFTKMLNYIEDYIVIVDNKGRIINLNDRFKELLRLEREKIVGKHCREFGIILDEIIPDAKSPSNDKFVIKGTEQQYSCLLQNHRTVKWLDNSEHTLLLFSTADSPPMRPKIANIKTNIDTFYEIIGQNTDFEKLTKMAKRAAKVPSNVLLDGESGTGKEVFARAIHNDSARASKPFIAINCGSIPKEILQSELFGYEDGAFTGGKKGGQSGKFEVADGGTILLDEIGEMPLEMQISLLRFLQDKTVTRVGGHHPRKVDVRIISATNKNLQQLVADGLFRGDLYYRLNVIRISLPPLRKRKDDILQIADYYVERFSKLFGLGAMALAQETCDLLYRYDWPGNIRELTNVIEKAVVYSENNRITPDLLPNEILYYDPGVSSISAKRSEPQEKEIIVRALGEAKGNVSEAAKAIGISRNTFYRKLDKYGLRRSEYWGNYM